MLNVRHMPTLNIQRLFAEVYAKTSYSLSFFSWQVKVFSVLKAGITKAKASFQWLLLYLQYTAWNLEAEIPCTEINNTNKTMQPDEPSSFGSIVAAAR